MILELAQIDVRPGFEQEFETAVAQATPLFARARGCKGFAMRRSVEKPRRYRLFITWETVESHTVEFRNSADFAAWRKLVGHCFESPPEVEHMQEVLQAF